MTQVKRVGVAAMAAIALLHCQTPRSVEQSRPGGATADLSGFAWSPDVYWLQRATCTEGCGVDTADFAFMGNPFFRRSLVTGATVRAVDWKQHTPVGSAASSEKGEWQIASVPAGVPPRLSASPNGITETSARTDNPTYFVTAEGGRLAPYEGPAQELTLPPDDFVPTATIRRIEANYSACAALPAATLSSRGILKAVADHLGGSASVRELLDTSKWHRVIIVNVVAPLVFMHPFLRQYGFPVASGVRLESNVGTILPIRLTHSAYSVVDKPDSRVSPSGLFAVLVRPEDHDSDDLVLTATDSVQDANSGRPWQSSQIRVPLTPGFVAFVPLHLSAPEIFSGAAYVMEWECR